MKRREMEKPDHIVRFEGVVLQYFKEHASPSKDEEGVSIVSLGGSNYSMVPLADGHFALYGDGVCYESFRNNPCERPDLFMTLFKEALNEGHGNTDA